MNSVLVNHLWPKLTPRDRFVLSTLCRDAASKECPDVSTTLHLPDDIVSFGAWVQRHHRELHSAKLSSSAVRSDIVAYLVAMCPNLTTLNLDMKNYDPFAFQFMKRLKTLVIHTSQCIDQHIAITGHNPMPALEHLMIDADDAFGIVFPQILPSLVAMSVTRGKVHDLPSMPSLRTLSLRDTRLEMAAVEQLEMLTTLYSLDLSGCRFQYVPDELSSLVNLEYLNLSRNSMINYVEGGQLVDDVLESIEQLPKLKHLDLSHNFLDEMGIDAILPRLQCPLESLDVSCNLTHDLPAGQYLSKLTSLRFSGIPSILGQCSSLVELSLHGHCSSHVPYDAPKPDLSAVKVPMSLKTVYMEDEHTPSYIAYNVFNLLKNQSHCTTECRA